MATLAAAYILSSLLLIGLSIPLMQRRIKPNWWYGFRTPTTLNNPDIWYEVNAYSGRLLLYAAIATLATAIILLPIPGMNVDVYASVVAVVVLIGITISVMLGYRRIGQMTKK